MQEFLMKVSEEFGASAHEEKIRKMIEAEIREYVDEISKDNLGNLIALKKGELDDEKIMISIPMDQICFIVTHIEKQRKYKFSMLSTVNVNVLPNVKVIFENGVRGKILKEEGIEGEDLDINKLYIQTNEEDENKYGGIGLGKVCIFHGEYMESDKYIKGVALYPRIGCNIVTNIIKSVSELKNDVYFVFTAHGMLGARGAIVATHVVNPTICIGIGAISSKNNVKLGKGPVLVVRDKVNVSHPELVSSIEETSKKNNISIQRQVSKEIYSDCMGVLKSGCNCKIANVSYPISDIYTNCETVYKKDIAEIEELIIRYIEK